MSKRANSDSNKAETVRHVSARVESLALPILAPLECLPREMLVVMVHFLLCDNSAEALAALGRWAQVSRAFVFIDITALIRQQFNSLAGLVKLWDATLPFSEEGQNVLYECTKMLELNYSSGTKWRRFCQQVVESPCGLDFWNRVEDRRKEKYAYLDAGYINSQFGNYYRFPIVDSLQWEDVTHGVQWHLIDTGTKYYVKPEEMANPSRVPCAEAIRRYIVRDTSVLPLLPLLECWAEDDPCVCIAFVMLLVRLTAPYEHDLLTGESLHRVRRNGILDVPYDAYYQYKSVFAALVYHFKLQLPLPDSDPRQQYMMLDMAFQPSRTRYGALIPVAQHPIPLCWFWLDRFVLFLYDVSCGNYREFVNFRNQRGQERTLQNLAHFCRDTWHGSKGEIGRHDERNQGPSAWAEPLLAAFESDKVVQKEPVKWCTIPFMGWCPIPSTENL